MDTFGAKSLKELERLEKLYIYEKKYYSEGVKIIAGVDEVGRGPLCGPVVAACVVLPEGLLIPYINDSKKLSAKKREELYAEITEKALAVSYAAVDNAIIDDINILNATKLAMKNALDNLSVTPGIALVDAVNIPDIHIRQTSIIRGDEQSASIAAASIIAKVIRDGMMTEYAKQYPGYGFERNKGYGTKEHMDAIRKYGLTPIHRRSFCKKLADC